MTTAFLLFEGHALIRTITRPSTARCTLPMYVGFLLSEPNGVSCSRLGSHMAISHDSVNRLLNRESYSPGDLFSEVKSIVFLHVALSKL